MQAKEVSKEEPLITEIEFPEQELREEESGDAKKTPSKA